MTENAAVLFANEAFYAAFANHDIEAMTDVWAGDGMLTCIHPGWPPLSGRGEVMESWRSILGNGSGPDIECRNAEAHISGEFAYVVCHEILEKGFLLATNIFIRQGGRWRMVHHQAGAAPPPPASDDAPTTVTRLQ